MLNIVFDASYYLQSEVLTSYFDFNKLHNFIVSFEKFFQKKEKKVLNLIKKLTGFDWEKEIINVWFFESWNASISYPLLLNVYDYNKDFVFFNLIHELVHINLFDLMIFNKKRKVDLIELEAIVNFITKQVIQSFYNKEKVNKLCKKAEFGGVYKYVWIRTNEINNEFNSLKKPNLKEWMLLNKNKYVIKK